MKDCLIRHIDGDFLCKSADDKWERTSNLDRAIRLEYMKAVNVLNNCICSVERIKWEIIEEDSIALSMGWNLDGANLNNYDWNEIVYTQCKLHNELTKYNEKLRHLLSEIDREICDIEHYIEFFSLDAARGYKAYRMLKERLERRRDIKREMARAQVFLAGTSADFASGKVSRQIKGIETCQYTPRILTELFSWAAAQSCPVQSAEEKTIRARACR